MCFAVIVGKNASKDGSVLFGHNEQNLDRQQIHYRRIPRRRAKGHMVHLAGGGVLEQVAETYSYLWVESPGLHYSDNCFNEWGVAIACDGCPTKEDALEEVAARGDIRDGGIGYMLPRLVAERARTAREGIEAATSLINRFGYTGTGRTVTIADPNEAWVLAVARGRHWIAQRVPDDAVVVIGSMHVIGPEADLKDTENVIASPGLVEYAVKRSWYDPSSGQPFSFKAAFARPHPDTMEESYGCCSRQWQAQALVTGKRPALPPDHPLPFAVQPSHPYGVADVAAVLRSHQEETEYDLRLVRQNGSPHEREEKIDTTFARCVCNIATQESVVWQLRNWPPPEIGCLAWRATSVPCTSVYTPWYACVEEIPRVYHDGCTLDEALSLEHHFQTHVVNLTSPLSSVYGTFHALSRIVDNSYASLHKRVAGQWSQLEHESFAAQPLIEQAALQLFEKDSVATRRFLSNYTLGRGLQAWQQARELCKELGGGNHG